MRNCVRASLSLLILLLCNTVIEAQDEPATRILRFPEDRSLGTLSIGKPVSSSYEEVRKSGGYKRIGPAQGAIEVPRGVMIQLDVSMDGCKDLSPLSKLEADSIHSIEFNIRLPIKAQLQYIKGLTSLRWLYIRSCAITDEQIQHISTLTNLESIHCSAYGTDAGITDKSMVVFRNMHKLRSLDLRGNHVTDEGLRELSLCNSLESLSLDGTDVTGVGLESLLLLPNLHTLSLGAYDEGAPVDDEGMKVISQLTQLRSLNLSGTLVTDEGLKHIGTLQNLLYLTLDYTEITEHGLAPLGQLKKLKKFRFYRKRGDLTDEGIKHLANCSSLEKITAHFDLSKEGIRHLTRLKNLTSFDFTGNITDDELDLVAQLTACKDLRLQNCKITDAGIAKLTPLTELEAFSLHGTKATTDCLETISRFPKLKRLRLGLEQNADAPFYWPTDSWDLIADLKELEMLTIDGLLLHDRHWPALAKLKKLNRLEIRQTIPLGSAFANEISKLESLRSLNLPDVKFLKEDFRQIAQLPSLEYLEFRGPVGGEHLDALAESKVLRIVRMRSSVELTEQDVEDFKTKCKSLETLNVSNYEGPSFALNDEGIVVHTRRPDGEKAESKIGEKPARLTIENSPTPSGDLDLTPYRGKILVVHFWRALTLGREPRPDEVHVRDVMKKFEGRGVEVVGIHSTEGAGRMERFIEEQEIDWPCYVDEDDKSAEAWQTGRRRNRIFLIGKDGKVRVENLYQGDLERALELLLAEESDQP